MPVLVLLVRPGAPVSQQPKQKLVEQSIKIMCIAAVFLGAKSIFRHPEASKVFLERLCRLPESGRQRNPETIVQRGHTLVRSRTTRATALSTGLDL